MEKIEILLICLFLILTGLNILIVNVKETNYSLINKIILVLFLLTSIVLFIYIFSNFQKIKGIVLVLFLAFYLTSIFTKLGKKSSVRYSLAGLTLVSLALLIRKKEEISSFFDSNEQAREKIFGVTSVKYMDTFDDPDEEFLDSTHFVPKEKK